MPRSMAGPASDLAGGKAQQDGLSHHHVTALYRDRRGRVWVGTDGGGLNQVLQDKTAT